MTSVENQVRFKPPKRNRWYLGGVAGSMAIMITNPADLIKVHAQTQKGANIGMTSILVNIIKKNGVLGLYSGISAALLRQITYNTTRYGLYEIITGNLLENSDKALPFYQKISISGLSGFAAGIMGNPAELINVRLQQDIKLPTELRRNYKHAFDGIYKVIRYEGVWRLYNGAPMTASRGLLASIGQVGFYDQAKQILLSLNLKDDVKTHLISSIGAAFVAILLTQPFDVLKTRLMNDTNHEYNGIKDLILKTRREGFLAFYKGFVPAFSWLAPQTILVWLFLEQLRILYPIN